MKQVININFQGRVVPIEVTAFDLLKQYTDSLNRHFASEEGKDEIINDIESRIGELFQERLKQGSTCITDEDVNAIIKSMGRPEDFETEAETIASTGSYSQSQNNTSADYQIPGERKFYRAEEGKWLGGVCKGLANYFGIDVLVVRIIFLVFFFAFGFAAIAYIILWAVLPSSASTVIGGAKKKLYRDTDDKIIGGVCSGIGNYFGINAWVPRLLFLIPFVTFAGNWGGWGDFPLGLTLSPGALILYIIMWLVLPEALTTSEKLEMKGEKVDMNSIKNSVMEEMRGMQQRAATMGSEAKAIAAEKSKMMGAEMGHIAKRSGTTLGDIIVLLFKIFAYFIIGSVLIGLIIALFAFGVFSIGMFPAKDFVLTNGWQNVFAWGTLIFFIAVPIIGIITWIVRRIAKIKTNRKLLRTSFGAMWILGLVCFIGLISSVGRDFKATSSINDELITLTNPAVQKLEVTSQNPETKFYRNRWFEFRPFESVEEDTALVRNVKVQIVRADSGDFKVSMLRLANGRNRRTADTLASLIDFKITQMDSILLLDKAVAINKHDKFRNQRVIVTIHVPVGKQIRIDESVGWGNDVRIEGPWDDDWSLEMDNVEHGWERDVTYTMKADGLYTLDGVPADEWRRKRNDNDEFRDSHRIHINENGIRIEDDADYRYEKDRHERALDSISEKRKTETERIKDSLQKAKEKLEEELKKVEEKTSPAASNNTELILPSYSPVFISMLSK